MTLREGFPHKGKRGVLIEDISYAPAGHAMEPSGHAHQQVRVASLSRWFHPYDGSPPIDLLERLP